MAEVAGFDARLRELSDLALGARTDRSDVEREQTKAAADTEQVRQRAARNQQRLDAGTLPAKDLAGLQHELASLAKRQGDLEDVELEILQRLEDIDTRLSDVAGQTAEVQAERELAVARRDATFAEIDGEAASSGGFRTTLGGQIDPALIALYEKVREQQGGVGAAALQHRRCQGCRIELNTVEINRIRAAPEDEVLRCEECRRILVRTAESGL